MGLCAWRDKNAYFSSSEKETRVKMLQIYLDRNNVPRPTEAPDSSFTSSYVETEGANQGNAVGQREDTPGEVSIEQRAEPPLLQEDASESPPEFARPSIDTPSSLPAGWDSARATPQQFGPDSDRSGTAQQAAAFVFLRYP